MLFSIINSIFSGGKIDVISVLMQIAAVLFIIFCILPLHEFAHGFAAMKLGDPTAKNSGRLTFNPLASVDPFGALCILLFGFGWAKPVPVNPRYFKHPKSGMAITALAGPLSNVLAALVGGILFNLIAAIFGSVPSFIYVFIYYYIMINVSLACFNLIPLPPLDGSKILGAFLPDKVVFNFYRYQRYIVLIVFAVLFLGVLDVPLAYFRSGVFSLVMWLADLPFKLFGLM